MPDPTLIDPRAPTRRGRKGAKQEAILGEIRQRILSGAYRPGDKIPTQVELMKEFRVSSITIQAVMERLIQQKFVRAKRGQGTFITDAPPHLRHYAVAFQRDPDSGLGWSKAHQALVDAGEQINEAGEYRLSYFRHLDAAAPNDDYWRLTRMVQNQQIAGIIFPAMPNFLFNTPIVKAPGIARVCIASAVNPAARHIPIVSSTALRTQEKKMLHYFLEAGVQRLASFHWKADFLERWMDFMPLLAEAGIHTRMHWAFQASPVLPQALIPCARLLMDLPPNERPDGILIYDDHLSQAVEKGLLLANDAEVYNLKILTHCNFPDHDTHLLPVKRIGRDSHRVLHTCIDIIDRQQRGETVPQATMVEDVFDHELPAERREF